MASELINQVESIYLSVGVAVASLTLLTVEYFQTIRLEITWIWPSKWNAIKYLYFVNRLLPFIVIPFAVIYNLALNTTFTACKAIFLFPSVGSTVCILLSEALLYARVYALSGCKRWALIFLSINGTIVGIIFLSLFSLYLSQGSWGPSQFAGIPGCFTKVVPNGQLVLIVYSTLLYNAFMTMVLCICFGVRKYWISRESRLIQIIYRDGTLYFVVIVVMSIINGIIALLLPSRYRFLLHPFQTVMHSTLSIRMILHLKAQARDQMGFTSVRVPQAGMDFAAVESGGDNSGDYTSSGGTFLGSGSQLAKKP